MTTQRTDYSTNPDLTTDDMDSMATQVNANTDAIAAAGGDLTSPLTTAGDIIVRGAASNVRKGIGTNGQVLRVNTSNADKLEYGTLAKADVGLSNVDDVPSAIILATASGRSVAMSIVFG